MTNSISQKLNALSKAASQGEWRYRPQSLDDWGIIRAGSYPDLPDGAVVAKSRFVGDDHDFSEHRKNKTDPFSANGEFIVALVNAYRSGDLTPPMGKSDEISARARLLDGDHGFDAPRQVNAIRDGRSSQVSGVDSSLLPCRFCGRLPHYVRRSPSVDAPHEYLHFITCFGDGSSPHSHVSGTGSSPTEAESDAVAKWNTRNVVTGGHDANV